MLEIIRNSFRKLPEVEIAFLSYDNFVKICSLYRKKTNGNEYSIDLLSRNKEKQNVSGSKLRLLTITDALALTVQITGMLWPLFLKNPNIDATLAWLYPVALVLCSSRWWSNFVSAHGNVGNVSYVVRRWIAACKEGKRKTEGRE